MSWMLVQSPQIGKTNHIRFVTPTNRSKSPHGVAFVASVVEELEEVDGGSVKHLPEHDQTQDAEPTCRHQLKRHAKGKQGCRDDRGETVSNVDVVPERTSVGIARIEERVAGPDRCPLAERKNLKHRDRASEDFPDALHLASAVRFFDLLDTRLESDPGKPSERFPTS